MSIKAHQMINGLETPFVWGIIHQTLYDNYPPKPANYRPLATMEDFKEMMEMLAKPQPIEPSYMHISVAFIESWRREYGDTSAYNAFKNANIMGGKDVYDYLMNFFAEYEAGIMAERAGPRLVRTFIKKPTPANKDYRNKNFYKKFRK